MPADLVGVLFGPDAQNATEGQDAVGDPAAGTVDHDVLEVTEGFVLRIPDFRADRRRCGQETG